jgi:hypothetical protein
VKDSSLAGFTAPDSRPTCACLLVSKQWRPHPEPVRGVGDVVFNPGAAVEPPLAGWTFQLIRQSSLFNDQDLGIADTQTTDGNGSLTFRLGANTGPGTYTGRNTAGRLGTHHRTRRPSSYPTGSATPPSPT